ncbi:MAG: lysylphosphatidylglycerol synthase domain-containing protein [Phycisphaerales bacterium JB059]
MIAPASEPTPRRASPRRVAGFVLSIALIALAIGAVAMRGEDIAQAMQHARSAPAWMIVLSILLPPLNLLLIGSSLWFITIRYGRVGFAEMVTLVTSAWLLNFLPMKPGLMGRIAYHKRVNEIRVKDSARALGESVAMSAIATGVLLGVALLLLGVRSAWAPVGAVGGAGLALLLFVPIARIRSERFALLGAAMFLRYLDIVVWIARYALLFALLDAPLTLSDAVLVTAASQVAQLIPFVGNGLGAREWGVGLVGAAKGATTAVALTADLLNRASEVVLAVPLGLLCTALVTRRLARFRSGGPLTPPGAPAQA